MTADTPPTGKAPGPEIVDNVEARRYEARVNGNLAGFVDYGRIQGRIVALHTEVFPEFGGRGIGSALVRRVLADAREAGVKITPRCPFFLTHFERHPGDRDLLAHPWRPIGAPAGDKPRSGETPADSPTPEADEPARS